MHRQCGDLKQPGEEQQNDLNLSLENKGTGACITPVAPVPSPSWLLPSQGRAGLRGQGGRPNSGAMAGISPGLA